MQISQVMTLYTQPNFDQMGGDRKSELPWEQFFVP